MIVINYPNGKKPPEAWIERAKALTGRLKVAPDKPTRDKIIDDNSHLWGEIKEWLEGFSYGKCWFSEARETYSYWQVEHFRPKKEAKDPDRDGYWWLAFDYLNYRLCGSVGNTKKGSYFPLCAGTSAAQCPDDNCDDEAPLLIDPIEEGDVMLLTFADGGKAVPAEQDGWHYERARKSIERYKLNDYPPLSRARADIWAKCRLDVDELETLMVKQKQKYSPSRERDIKAIVKRLADRTRPSAEFSSVARAFLAQHPRQWAKRCIAS
jgi:hypothetical protein